MNRPTKTACWLILLLGAALAGGCNSARPLQIEPVGKKGVAIQPKFENACYRYDADGTLFFVGRSRSTDKATGQTVEQIATVRVFWRPVGGKTSLNDTSLNATYRYVLMTEHAVGVYEGAGFVRIWGKNGQKLDARVMDGDLRLTESSTSFNDTLGRSRIRGSFSAKYDDARAMDMLLQAHRDLFYRSLTLKPEEPVATTLGAATQAAATQEVPATQPAATQGAATQEEIRLPGMER
jgi:hypothetical protein